MPLSIAQLQLEAKRAALLDSNTSNENPIESLFPHSKPSSIVVKHLFLVYKEASLDLIRMYAKFMIHEAITKCDTKFIREVEASNPEILNSGYFKTTKLRLTQLKVDEKTVKQINGELWRYINVLIQRFAPRAPEINLRRLIINWFESGEMSLTNFEKWVELKDDLTLEKLKEVQWIQPTEHDLIFSRFKDAIFAIKTDDFVDKKAWETMMNILLKPIQIDFRNTETGGKNETTVQISTTVLYLSKMKEELQKQYSINLDNDLGKITEIRIFTKSVFHIDSNLKIPGINFVVVADRVKLWDKHEIDVSGKNEDTKLLEKPEKAETGKDGKNALLNAKSGESSGNILIVTLALTPDMLTIKLNGGNGQRGQDGGDGGDGAHGIGIEKEEFEEIRIKYDSIYFTDSNHFFEYEPYGWDRLEAPTKCDEKKHYIYAEYEERNVGRKIYYSYSAHKDFILLPTSYELSFHVEGTTGKQGGKGGENGFGGSGGNCGECNIINPSTTEKFKVTITAEPGKTGDDGTPGENGNYGINGRDMAMTDKSKVTADAKYFYGIEDKIKLARKYGTVKGERSIYDGSRKAFGLPDCFAYFTESKIESHSLTKERREKKTRNEAEKRNEAKKSIVMSEVMDKASDLFVNDNASLAAVCQPKEESDKDEEIEKESQASVAEETSILRERSTKTSFFVTKETVKKQKSYEDYQNLFLTLFSCEGKMKITPSILSASREKRQFINAVITFLKIKKCTKSMEELLENELSAKLIQKLNMFVIPFIVKQCSQYMECMGTRNFLLKYENYNMSFLSILPNVKNILNQKEEYAKFRRDAKERFKAYINSSQKQENKVILDENNFITNVKLDLNGVSPISATKIRQHIEEFFKWHSDNDLAIDLLEKAYNAWKNISRILKDIDEKEIFNDSDFNWNDELAEPKFLTKYFPKLKKKWWEKAKLFWKSKKDNFRESMKQQIKASETSAEVQENRTEQALNNLDEDEKGLASAEEAIEATIFEDVKAHVTVNAIINKINKNLESKDAYKRLNNSFQSWKKAVKEDNYLEFKFGAVPDFKKPLNDTDVSYLIKFYFQIKQTLVFQSHLLTVNNFINQNVFIPSGLNTYIDDEKPENIMQKLKVLEESKNFSTLHEIKHFMITHGTDCAAWRYLWAHLSDKNIRVYGNEVYGKMEVIESFNSQAKECIRFGVIPGCQKVLPLCVDENLQLLTEHRHTFSRFCTDFKTSIISINQDFTDEKICKLFSSYCPDEYQAVVCEWIAKYIAATDDQTLLKLFYHRFSIDQNHLDLLDFQFILNSAMAFKICNQENFDFAFAVAATFKQTRLTDSFLYILIETVIRRKMSNKNNFPTNFFKSVKKIKTKVLKSLLASKLNDAVLNEDVLMIVLNMLCHTSDSQLLKMNLTDWIEIAKHQNWSGDGTYFGEFGSIGYYLSFLNYQRHPAHMAVEKFFKTISGNYMVEKLIAKLIFLINQNEIHVFDKNDVRKEEVSTELSKNIKEILAEVRVHAKKVTVSETKFITDQKMQNEILNSINPYDLEKIFPSGDRNLEQLKEIMLKSRDNVSHEEIKGYFDALEDNENYFNKWITVIDEVLSKSIRKIHLRDTQKLAIISAVMGTSAATKRFLAQVNTGEGKSFVIAAIAIIQAKTLGTVDIITSSSVLAKRDSEELTDIYKEFDLTVSHNCDENTEKRKISYKANVVYGDIASFQRDYLLHTFYKKNILGDRQRKIVIVDEVDNMLLDNGNNMLYLSHQVAGMERMDSLFVFIHKLVHMPLINSQMKTKEIEVEFDTKMIKEKVMIDLTGKLDIKYLDDKILTDKIVQTAWNKLVELEIINRDGYLNKLSDAGFELVKKDLEAELGKCCPQPLVSRILVCLKVIVNRERFISVPDYLKDFCILHLDEYIESCKKSMFLKHKNEYVIDVDHTREDSDLQPKVTIVDQNTGVDLSNSQWSEGLHQCVQLKHGCRLLPITLKAVFISNVLFLKGYEIINGLSGTLGSAEESQALADLYEAKLIRIPTSKLKDFYEKIPVICENEEQWAKEIYDEIKNMISAKRSILIIGQTIEEVDKLKDKLDNICKCNPDDTEMGKCINSVVLYTRDFHPFNYNGANALKAGEVILSTNLAGRGTDIKLDEEVKKNGGLHVIVTFLPENCRIEEQAYGRASRSGDPGSAQIITLAKDGQNSPFQLKEFRDNAEIHRLKSIKNYYQFHTQIEELCLDKFRKYCNQAFENISQTNSADEDVLPNEKQVKYFALLDAWALWLDKKSPEIKHCAETCNEAEKGAIVASVEEFLKAHSADSDAELTWVKAPQPLLTLALLYFSDEKKCKALLNQVAERFPEYMDDALYYRALLEQQHIRRPKNLKRDVKILEGFFDHKDENSNDETGIKWKDMSGKERFKFVLTNNVFNTAWAGTKFCLDYLPLEISKKTGNGVQKYGKKAVDGVNFVIAKTTNFIDDVIQNYVSADLLIDKLIQIDEKKYYITQEFFHFARQHFALRLDQREDAIKIVSNLQDLGGPEDIRVNGFVEQSKQLKRIIECLIANIDAMVGECIDWQTFNHDKNPAKAYRVYSILKSQGFISQPVLCYQEMPTQLEVIKRKYFLSNKFMSNIFKEIREDPLTETFNSLPIMSKEVLQEKILLPCRENFWDSLRHFGCFKKVKHCFHIDEERMNEISFLSKLEKLTVESSPFSLTLSNSPSDRTLYCKEFLDKMVKNREIWAEELDYLLEENIIVHDCWAIINPEKYFEYRGYLGDYKTVSAKDLAEYLEVDEIHATKIMMQLVDENIFLPNKRILRRINKLYVPKETTIAEVPYSAETIKAFCEKFKKFDHISDEIIQIEFDLKTSSQILDAISTLEKEQIVEVWKKMEYFPLSTIDCTVLPKCLQNDVEAFLTNQCSYALAYNCLSETLFKSVPSNNEEIKNVQKVIMIPWNPHNDLFQDFIKYGIIIPSRFFYKEEPLVDFKQFDDPKAIKDIVDSRKSMLTQKSASLQSTNSYFQDKSVMVPPEVKQTVTNSLKQVATITENTVWKWYLAIGIVVGIIGAVILFYTVGAPLALYIIGSMGVFARTLLISLLVLAAVGTVAYFNQVFRAQSKTQISVQKPNQKNAHQWVGPYTTMLAFHEAEEMQHKKAKNNAVLIKIIGDILNDATYNLQSNFLKFVEINKPLQDLVKNAIKNHNLPKPLTIHAINISVENSSNFRFIEEHLETITKFYYYSVSNKLYNCLKNEYRTEKFNVIEISKQVKNMNINKLGNELEGAGIKSMATKFGEDLEDALKKNVAKEDSETAVEVGDVNELLDIWKTKLSELLQAKIQRILTNTFNEPTKEILSHFIDNCDDETVKRSKKENESIEAQILEKQKINEKSLEIATTKHVKHIAKEAEKVLKTMWNTDKSMKVLIHMIHYDYALPLSSLPYIVEAVSIMLQQKKKDIKFCRIFLTSDNNRLNEYSDEYDSKEVIEIELKTSKGNYFLINKTQKEKNSIASLNFSIYELLDKVLPEFEHICPSGSKDFKQLIVNIFQQQKVDANENVKFINNDNVFQWKMPLVAKNYFRMLAEKTK